MFAKVSIIATCLLVAAVSAKPHVLTPVAGPAYVTAHSSQVFARTYHGIVPIAVSAPVPTAPVPVPYPTSFAAFYVPHAGQTVFSYPFYAPAPAAAVPATPAFVATPAAVVPAAKVVAAAPVAKVVRTAPYLTTIRYRSVVG
ncbi:calphotin-like [Ochlerotatus camptorhynchus]|uniref:calphotin-like n=1 Tax=Ochlerotatus camptorhynchus TaxID=644619 RepID=UPI0031DACC4F